MLEAIFPAPHGFVIAKFQDIFFIGIKVNAAGQIIIDVPVLIFNMMFDASVIILGKNTHFIFAEQRAQVSLKKRVLPDALPACDPH